MANAVLYKKLKDVPVLPPIRLTDPCRTLDGFQAVPKFKGQKDPSRGETWVEADTDEWSSIVAGYWWAYDKDYADLNKLFLLLKKKEDMVAEQKQKVEEAQKRKEVAVPVASGSGKGKGKMKEVVQDTDSESIVKEEFRETCLNCKENKAICVFTYLTAGKKMSCDRCFHRKMVNGHIEGLKVDTKDRNMLAGEELYHKYNLQQQESLRWAQSVFMEVVKLDIRLRELEVKLKTVGQLVPEDLLDDTEQGHMHIISKHNYIAHNCAFNMKQLATQYALGKGHEAKALLMDAQGGIEVADVMESGKKRSRDDKDVGPGSSKNARVEDEVVRKEGQGSREREKRVEVEKGVEPEKEMESAPSTVGGSEKRKEKEKEKDMRSEILGEDTMKEKKWYPNVNRIENVTCSIIVNM
ncbi:hypothetical protein M422DRAFT_271631 [Sphaerobolus stellatus SS14]|uniref:Uncharacterized protein n=1 Tax=Sphaerobolus stellatus (strain SS14) TaxID=990650 RepID=A0A0C9TZM2_SPHS4|nr:hypothetical protein M422DRAFT_271631 [Sphaerobolus stellatus SS14]